GRQSLAGWYRSDPYQPIPTYTDLYQPIRPIPTSSEQDTLNRPEKSRQRERRGGRHHDQPAIRLVLPDPAADDEDRKEQRGELTSAHAGVEGGESRRELARRPRDLMEPSGEPHAVQQAEAEYQRQSPRLVIRGDHTLERHVDDRQRDHRLDGRGRQCN